MITLLLTRLIGGIFVHYWLNFSLRGGQSQGFCATLTTQKKAESAKIPGVDGAKNDT